MKSTRIYPLIALLGILFSGLHHLWFAQQWRGNFDADEAIFAWMSRHILAGETPLYMYGDQYIGSLESWIAVPFMALLGESVFSFRLASVFLSMLFYGATYWTLQRFWTPKIACIGTIFTAFPTWLLFYWLFRPIGGFNVMMLCGVALIALSTVAKFPVWVRLFLIGLLGGVSLWTQQMTVIFLASMGLVWLLGTPEWAAFYHRFIPKKFLGWMTAIIILITLGLLALFSQGCSPSTLLTSAKWIARILIGIGGLFAVWQFWKACQNRMARVTQSAVLALGGFIGTFAIWGGLFLWKTPISSALAPSCPTGIPGRANLIFLEIFPVLLGGREGLWSDFFRNEPLTAVVGFIGMSLPLIGMVMFGWHHRTAVKKIVTLAPLQKKDHIPVTIFLLFSVPILLSLFGSNTINVLSIRYFLITWLATMWMFAWWVGSQKSAVYALTLIPLWLLHVWMVGYSLLHTRWPIDVYADEPITELQAYLNDQEIDGVYADYWLSFPIGYFMEEVTFAPYNGLDRYPKFSEDVIALDAQAFLFNQGVIEGESTTDVLRQQLATKHGAGDTFSPVLEGLHGRELRTRTTIGTWDIWIVD